eukprot:CAMPEP_0174760138 /NCGR_PEP_ID=MMETSP1094-20130205/108620_1 /TAXON_ID=156173 /ORGANISM="Chrysochromulina brevifilum, Strain UTEX LB 985" /LENGTH=199 /DNA_ID=CAMNT_0015966079 /DNA_START=166 /DNA_END=765 /DNA_ORIENTATION=+
MASSVHDPMATGTVASAFEHLARLTPGPYGKSSTASAASGALVDLTIAIAGAGVNLSIVRTMAAAPPPVGMTAAVAPAALAVTTAPPKALPSQPGDEDPATNAKLLAMLGSQLGEPNGRWGTSTHEAVRTSEEAAQVRGASLASGAKAMLLATKPSDEFVLAVISASEKMDSKAFKKAGGFKSTKFATEEEVWLRIEVD